MASAPSPTLPSSAGPSKRSPCKSPERLIRSPVRSVHPKPNRRKSAKQLRKPGSASSVGVVSPAAPEDELPRKTDARPPWKYKVEAKHFVTPPSPRTTSPGAGRASTKGVESSKDIAGLRPTLLRQGSNGTPPRVEPPLSMSVDGVRDAGVHPPEPDSKALPDAGESDPDQWGAFHQPTPAASNDPASEHRSRPPSTSVNCLAAALGSLVALILVFSVYRLISVRSKQSEPGRNLCMSGQCRYHANLITNHINRSADPCEDFEAFACSQWADVAETYGYGAAIMRLQIATWFTEFKAVLTEGARLIPVGVRAENMYELCMSDVNDTAAKSGVRLLKSFMLERGLRWPERPLPGVEPLGVLLDLAYHWRLGLWFDASHLETTPAGSRERSRTLLIEPGAFVGAWAAQHDSVISNDAYAHYWRALELAFSEPNTKPRPVNISKIVEREGVILHELSTILYSTVRRPVRFPIEDVERFTPDISKGTWIQEIANRTAEAEVTKVKRKSFESITVSDIAILEVLNKLYVRYNRDEILDHLSWFFVQVFASLADRQNLRHKYGSKDFAEKRRYLFCATEVEASNQFLIAALYARLHSSGDARNTVLRRLEAVKKAALEKIFRGTSWAKDSSRDLIATKVRNQQVILWPPPNLLSDDALSDMYENVREYRGSFIEYWLDAYNHTRSLLSDPRYDEAMKLARNFVLPYFEYDYVSNAVRVAIGAVDIPLYAEGSTHATFYGGLGFSYAAQLVRAFDEGGLTIDPHGAINVSWALPSWKRNCSNDRRSPFPEIPAIQVAHAAFLQALANGSQPAKCLMEDYTEEQVFFIVACFTLCQVERNAEGSYGGDCNRAVKNFAPFAEAFACRDGSSMKPTNRCLYFD
ncbi:neprilysin-2-like [Haemaphysalis longicornis]